MDSQKLIDNIIEKYLEEELFQIISKSSSTVLDKKVISSKIQEAKNFRKQLLEHQSELEFDK